MKFVLFRKKVITRLGVNGKEPYLIRWNLFQCPWFSIKLHKILISDDGCLHDHPWNFISFILKGGYVEQSWDQDKIGIDPTKDLYLDYSKDFSDFPMKKRIYGPGSILWRPAKFAHRLDIYQPAITLVITFQKTRQWGFFTPIGWLPHFKHNSENACES